MATLFTIVYLTNKCLCYCFIYVQVFCTAKNLNCRDSQGYGSVLIIYRLLLHIKNNQKMNNIVSFVLSIYFFVLPKSLMQLCIRLSFLGLCVYLSYVFYNFLTDSYVLCRLYQPYFNCRLTSFVILRECFSKSAICLESHFWQL